MKFSKRTLLVALSLVMALSATAFGTIAYLTDSKSVTNTFTYGDVSITLDESLVNENGEQLFPIEGEEDLYVSMDENGVITVTKGDESAVVEEGQAVIGDVTYDVALDENGNIVVNGKPAGENPRVTANEYKLVPGERYWKDPTVTVTAGSEESYVRVKVTFTNYAALQALATEGGYADVFAMLIPTVNTTDWTLYGTAVVDTTADTVTYEYRYNTAVKPSKTEGVEVPALFTEITVPAFFDADDLETLQAGSGFKIVIDGYAVQALGFGDADAAWAAAEPQFEE